MKEGINMSEIDDKIKLEKYYQLRNSKAIDDLNYCNAFLKEYRDSYQMFYIESYNEFLGDIKLTKGVVAILKEWLFDRDLEYIDKLSGNQGMLVYGLFLEGLSFDEIKEVIDRARMRKNN